jgi:hypothetical protein
MGSTFRELSPYMKPEESGDEVAKRTEPGDFTEKRESDTKLGDLLSDRLGELDVDSVEIVRELREDE